MGGIHSRIPQRLCGLLEILSWEVLECTKRTVQNGGIGPCQEADAQDIQIEPYRTTGEAVLSEPILNSGQKYVFAPEHRGWHWHNERARGDGGHIASITSAKENEDITRISGGAPVCSVESERGIGTAGNLCRTGEAVKLAKWARALKTGTGLMADLGHTRTGGLASRTIMIRAKIGCNT